MIQLTEIYSSTQREEISKLKELGSVLHIVQFAALGVVQDIYQLSVQATVEGMKLFSPNFSSTIMPIGSEISLKDFIGFDLEKEFINIRDYSKPSAKLAYALLEPPYNLSIKINAEWNTYNYYEIKTIKYTEVYKSFIKNLLCITNLNQDEIKIFEWSDNWSDFFDDGKEWWGTFYWTIYNKRNNTIIVLGASSTD